MNKLLSLDMGSVEFRNVELPTMNIPAFSAAPLWDDFFLTGGSFQGVFYQLGPNNRSVIFEYRLRRAGVPESLYQFQLLYDADEAPGVVRYRYFATADLGSMSTVGVQGCKWFFFFGGGGGGGFLRQGKRGYFTILLLLLHLVSYSS